MSDWWMDKMVADLAEQAVALDGGDIQRAKELTRNMASRVRRHYGTTIPPGADDPPPPDPTTWDLSVTAAGTGTSGSTVVDDRGQISVPGDGSGTYNDGTVVTLTADPGGSNVFSGWSGAASGTGTNTTLTMNADKAVTATFATPQQSGGYIVPGTILPVQRQDLIPNSTIPGAWNYLSANKPGNVVFSATGGDPHPLVDGTTNATWRRHSIDHTCGTTGTSERLQLGNSNASSESNTFKQYSDGETWITYWSMRMHNITTGKASQIWEMFSGGQGQVHLSMDQLPNNQIGLVQQHIGDATRHYGWGPVTVPENVWMRFAIAIHYTTSRTAAKVQLWGSMTATGDLSLKRLTPTITGYETLRTVSGEPNQCFLIFGPYQSNDVTPHALDAANFQVCQYNPASFV